MTTTTMLKPVTTEELHSLMNAEGYIEHDLSNRDFTNADLKSLAFVDCNLSGSNFRGAVLTDVYINGGYAVNCDFKGAKFIDCTLKCVNIDESNLSHTVHVDSELEGLEVNFADFYGMRCLGSNLSMSNFFECVFLSTDLRGTQLDGAVFTNCPFDEADISYTNIENTSFEDCSTRHVALVGTKGSIED